MLGINLIVIHVLKTSSFSVGKDNERNFAHVCYCWMLRRLSHYWKHLALSLELLF